MGYCVTILVYTIAFAELIYAATCVYDFLFTGIERMTLVADVHFKQISFFGCAHTELGAASAYYINYFVLGMYFFFHYYYLVSVLSNAYLLYIFIPELSTDLFNNFLNVRFYLVYSEKNLYFDDGANIADGVFAELGKQFGHFGKCHSFINKRREF